MEGETIFPKGSQALLDILSSCKAELVQARQDYERVRQKCGILETIYRFNNNIETDMIMEQNKVQISYFNEFMMKILSKLKEYSEEDGELKDFLKDYLLRLQELADRDSSLQELYGAYQQAFGGHLKCHKI